MPSESPALDTLTQATMMQFFEWQQKKTMPKMNHKQNELEDKDRKT